MESVLVSIISINRLSAWDIRFPKVIRTYIRNDENNIIMHYVHRAVITLSLVKGEYFLGCSEADSISTLAPGEIFTFHSHSMWSPH